MGILDLVKVRAGRCPCPSRSRSRPSRRSKGPRRPEIPSRTGRLCAPEFNLLTTKSKPRALPSGFVDRGRTCRFVRCPDARSSRHWREILARAGLVWRVDSPPFLLVGSADDVQRHDRLPACLVPSREALPPPVVGRDMLYRNQPSLWKRGGSVNMFTPDLTQTTDPAGHEPPMMATRPRGRRGPAARPAPTGSSVPVGLPLQGRLCSGLAMANRPWF